jgi:hypothetical protein
VIASLSIGIEILLKLIWEEEDLEDSEHDKKFNYHDEPELFTNGHI